jgi:hypothetical protein
MPNFAATLAHAVYAALGNYPLQEIHKLPQLISGELERPPVTTAAVKAFRQEYETDGAPDNSSALSFSPELERVLKNRRHFRKTALDSTVESNDYK